MIYPIFSTSLTGKIYSNNKVIAFSGNNVIPKYVKSVNAEHVPMLEKLGEFFQGLKEILKNQYKNLSTQSGSLKVSNTAEPIPEAVIDIGADKVIKLSVKKFRNPDVKLDLCHVEFNNLRNVDKFDIVMNDLKTSPKKGDIFSFNFHRADKHPIKDSEAGFVNQFFEKYSQDISNIIRKYQKKLS